jgi:hypothetical protein
MGIEHAGKDEAQLQALINSKISESLQANVQMQGLKNQVDQLTKDLGTEQGKVTTLTSEKTALEASAKIGNDYVTQLRAEVTATLNALHNNAPDAALLTAINNSGLEALTAFKKTYDAQLEEKAPLVCQDCQSSNVSRQSAQTEEHDHSDKGGKPAGDAKTSNSIEEAANTIKASKKSQGFSGLYEEASV